MYGNILYELDKNKILVPILYSVSLINRIIYGSDLIGSEELRKRLCDLFQTHRPS